MLNGKLVTSGNYIFHIQINQGIVFTRDDMTITHEEADTIIVAATSEMWNRRFWFIHVTVDCFLAD